MVFDISKYEDEIVEFLRSDDPQKMIDDWLESGISGKGVNFTTLIPRKTVVRKYLKNVFNFDYYIDPQDIERYKKIKDEQFESKPKLKIDYQSVINFIERMNDEEYKFSDNDLQVYNEGNKRDPRRVNISNKISNIFIYLMFTSGRRLNEIHDKIIGVKGDEIEYRATKKYDKVVNLFFNPLIDVDRWWDLHQTIIPFIQNESVETLTSRLNRFIKINFPDFTTHTARKAFSELHVLRERKNGNKKRKVAIIKKALGHDNIKSSEHYNSKLVYKKKCEICNMDVLRKNYSRHLKSKRHTALEGGDDGVDNAN